MCHLVKVDLLVEGRQEGGGGELGGLAGLQSSWICQVPEVKWNLLVGCVKQSDGGDEKWGWWWSYWTCSRRVGWWRAASWSKLSRSRFPWVAKCHNQLHHNISFLSSHNFVKPLRFYQHENNKSPCFLDLSVKYGILPILRTIGSATLKLKWTLKWCWVY